MKKVELWNVYNFLINIQEMLLFTQCQLVRQKTWEFLLVSSHSILLRKWHMMQAYFLIWFLQISKTKRSIGFQLLDTTIGVVTSSPRMKLLWRMRGCGVKRGASKEPFSMKVWHPFCVMWRMRMEIGR